MGPAKSRFSIREDRIGGVVVECKCLEDKMLFASSLQRGNMGKHISIRNLQSCWHKFVCWWTRPRSCSSGCFSLLNTRIPPNPVWHRDFSIIYVYIHTLHITITYNTYIHKCNYRRGLDIVSLNKSHECPMNCGLYLILLFGYLTKGFSTQGWVVSLASVMTGGYGEEEWSQ